MAEDFVARLGKIPANINASTIHSICFRLLAREFGLTRKNVALPWVDFVKFCRGRRIPISEEDLFLDEEECGEDRETVGGKIYTIYTNCVNTLTPFEKWRELPDYMRPEFDRIPKNYASVDDLVIDTIDGWIRYLEKHDKVDFAQMLYKAYELRLKPDMSIAMSDESHDMTPIQVALTKLWTKDVDEFYVAFDVNQCVVKGTKILTPSGWKKVEEIKPGDTVVSAMGMHRVTNCKVLATHSEVVMKRIIEFETESGKRIEVTDDHLMFVYIPHQRSASDDYWFVYFMNKNNRWRIGITKAKNVVEGLYVPVYRDGVIKYERIVRRREKFGVTEVYDLEVEKTHNYIANGIVVHNCIYSFWGTTPDFCKEIWKKADERIVLSPSHRISQEVYEFARNVLRMSGQTSPDVECVGKTRLWFCPAERFLEAVRKLKPAILARTRFQLKRIAQILRDSGMIFTGVYGWSDRMISVYRTVWLLRKRKPVSGKDFEAFLDAYPTEFFKVKKHRLKSVMPSKLDPDLVFNVVTPYFKTVLLKRKDPFSFVNRSAFNQRAIDAMNEALAKGIEPVVYAELHTIHGAKGLEWDYVLVVDGITPRIKKSIRQYREEFENECRVWYVAFTRARKLLGIVDYSLIDRNIPFVIDRSELF
jgi:hypothetical protein